MPEEKEFRRHIKHILKGYRTMTPKVQRELEHLGFVYIRSNKHDVLEFTRPDGSSCKFTLSKTVTDYRTGQNIASTICNTIYSKS